MRYYDITDITNYENDVHGGGLDLSFLFSFYHSRSAPHALYYIHIPHLF